jgi:hypothetical protein
MSERKAIFMGVSARGEGGAADRAGTRRRHGHSRTNRETIYLLE